MYNPQLKTFVCVADSGSFNKAAEELFISSTAVMKQINSLENHLDLKLFDRTNHGILLTPAGKVIYKHANALFSYSEKAISEARRTLNTEETTFKIGTSILNPCKPFMDLWYGVNDQFPGYRLQIIPFEDSHTGALTEISSLGTKYDFLIGGCDSKQWLERCNFLQIGTYRQCIAVPREHPLANRQKLTLQELFGETILMVKSGDSPTVDCIREELQKYPLIHIEDTPQFYDMEVFNYCVQQGFLLVTLECWADVHPSLITLPVEWDFSLPYGILYASNPTKEIKRVLTAIQNIITPHNLLEQKNKE